MITQKLHCSVSQLHTPQSFVPNPEENSPRVNFENSERNRSGVTAAHHNEVSDVLNV